MWHTKLDSVLRTSSVIHFWCDHKWNGLNFPGDQLIGIGSDYPRRAALSRYPGVLTLQYFRAYHNYVHNIGIDTVHRIILFFSIFTRTAYTPALGIFVLVQLFVLYKLYIICSEPSQPIKVECIRIRIFCIVVGTSTADDTNENKNDTTTSTKYHHWQAHNKQCSHIRGFHGSHPVGTVLRGKHSIIHLLGDDGARPFIIHYRNRIHIQPSFVNELSGIFVVFFCRSGEWCSLWSPTSVNISKANRRIRYIISLGPKPVGSVLFSLSPQKPCLLDLLVNGSGYSSLSLLRCDASIEMSLIREQSRICVDEIQTVCFCGECGCESLTK